MECPNYKNVSKYISVCSILRDEFNIQYIQSLSRAGCPCHKCKNEWIDEQPPTKDSLTTPMKAIVKANGKIELPTITEQVTSFVSSVAKWVGNGFENLPKEESDLRVSICEKNSCSMFEPKERRCLACSCFVDLKSKWGGEDCPAGLWPKVGTEYLNQPNPIQKCRSCGH